MGPVYGVPGVPGMSIDPSPVLNGLSVQSAGAIFSKMCLGMMLASKPKRYGSKNP